eukprot:scaffold3.g6554.t1
MTTDALDQDNYRLRLQLSHCQAALNEAAQARAAAEQELAAVRAGQDGAHTRELQSLQSLFRQALEESRSLQRHLAASRARTAELEAQVTNLQMQLWPCQQQLLHQPQQQPVHDQQQVFAQHTVRATPSVPLGTGGGRRVPGLQAPGDAAVTMRDGLVAQCLGEQLEAVRLTDGEQASGREASTSSAEVGTACQQSTDGSVRRPLLAEAPAVELLHQALHGIPAASWAEPAPCRRAQGPEAAPAYAAPAYGGPPISHAAATTMPASGTPAGDMTRIYGEIAVLQQRLQAAEQQLLLGWQAGQAGTLERQGAAPATAGPVPAGGLWGCGPAANPPAAATGAQPPWEAAAARRPGSPLSPSARREQQHRESWELIHTLRQRKANLESLQASAAASTVARAALMSQSPRPCAPAGAADKYSAEAAVPWGEGEEAGRWMFDGRGLPAGTRMRQPAPVRLSAPHGAVCHEQQRSVSAPRRRAASPAAWEARQQEQRWQGRQGEREPSCGWRRSASADRSAQRHGPVHQPTTVGGSGRSRSRSRQEQEEISKLLSAGRSAVERSACGRVRARPWAAPVVVGL